MIDGIRQWLTTTAASAPTLLVIEDLHWSTATTRDVVRQLVRTAGRARLLVVATTRDTAPDLDVDLATLLADLERSPAVTRLGLRGLDRDEVAALVGVARRRCRRDHRRHRRQPAARQRRDWPTGRPGSLVGAAGPPRRPARRAGARPARSGGDVRRRVRRQPPRDRMRRPAARRARVAGGRGGRRVGRPAAGTAGPVRVRPRPVPLAPLRRPLRSAAASTCTPAQPARWRAPPATGGCRSEPATPAWRCRSAMPRPPSRWPARRRTKPSMPTPTTRPSPTTSERIVAARSLDPPDARTTHDLSARLGAALVRGGDPRGVPMLRRGGRASPPRR